MARLMKLTVTLIAAAIYCGQELCAQPVASREDSQRVTQCPSGKTLLMQKESPKDDHLKLYSSPGNWLRLNYVEKLTGSCVKELRQFVLNLIRTTDGRSFNLYTKKLAEHGFLPLPVPEPMLRAVQSLFDQRQVALVEIYDVTKLINSQGTCAVQYFGIGRKGSMWVIVAIHKSGSGPAILTTLARSKASIRGLSYVPGEDGPSGTIGVLQEVGPNQLRNVGFDWIYSPSHLSSNPKRRRCGDKDGKTDSL